MRTLAIFLCVAAISCGESESGVRGSAPEAPKAMLNQALLSEFQQPTDLEQWNSEAHFFGEDAKSAYVVAFQHPFDEARFVAWGFDLKTYTLVFFVTGNRASQLSGLLSQVALDIHTHVAFDLEFTYAMAMAVGKKPGPVPPSGDDWSEWTQAAYAQAWKLEAAVSSAQ